MLLGCCDLPGAAIAGRGCDGDGARATTRRMLSASGAVLLTLAALQACVKVSYISKTHCCQPQPTPTHPIPIKLTFTSPDQLPRMQRMPLLSATVALSLATETTPARPLRPNGWQANTAGFDALVGVADAHAGVATALALLGKTASSGAFTAIYVLTTQVYPTRLTAAGLGCGSMFGKIGAALGPPLSALLPLPLSLAIIGSLSLAAGTLTGAMMRILPLPPANKVK